MQFSRSALGTIARCWRSALPSVVIASIITIIEAQAAVAQTQLLVNPGFDGPYVPTASLNSGTVAKGWIDNSWPGGKRWPSYAMSSDVGRGGTGTAQKLVVSSIPTGAGVALWQQNLLPYTAGTVWEYSIWLRASGDISVKVAFRQPGQFYRDGAVLSVRVGPAWTQVKIKGGFASSDPAQVGIRWRSGSGTLWMDDASLTVGSLSLVGNRGTVLPTFFAMGYNKYYAGGPYSAWPAVRPGMARIWDLGDRARWSNLEPDFKGNWQWTGRDRTGGLDHFVDAAFAADQQILYTLGQTPAWASARPSETGLYGSRELGAPAEPFDLRDWRDYVRAVATRFKGKIRHYELWNEPGYAKFFSGTPAKMVELARAARAELKAVDPRNVLLTPSHQTDNLGWMDDFLFAGGGRYVDAVSTHHYSPLAPELGLATMEAVKNLFANNGLSSLPIWNTEGQVRAGEGMPAPTDAQARAGVARAYITQRTMGFDAYVWYCWDLAWPDSVTLADQTNFTTLTAGGTAYREVRRWLVGQNVGSTTIDDTMWTVETLRADGYVGRIVWNTTGDKTWSIPVDWGIVQKRTLAGGIEAVSDGRSLTVGTEPILLENRADALR